ncbi:short-chain dehydrogenase/reductase SDR [Chondrocystis sp. NIES-4102]|nr:short-chain dehydrogenase/reductase SDR [Chondrocystis sp. NIES-4102]
MKTIALVTGANKGMGFETARQLAKQETHVLIGARDTHKGETAVKSLLDQGLSTEFLPLDITKEESVKQAAQTVSEKYGKLDILINNAGINPEYSQGIFTWEELPLDLLISIYQTNVFGAFLTIREFLPLLKKSTAGRIVNVSSSLGSLTEQSNPESPSYPMNTLGYNSSKTALNALTVQLKKQLVDTPIKVNSVCPGWVKTDMGTDAAPRTIIEGVRIILKLASLEEDIPNGGFFNEDDVISW